MYQRNSGTTQQLVVTFLKYQYLPYVFVLFRYKYILSVVLIQYKALLLAFIIVTHVCYASKQ